MQRTLCAVLAADVVGYSRLMGEDSGKTLVALRRLRAELFGPAVAGHRGKLVKSMGDGWIVTFASAVDAVTCAMRLQDKMVVEPEIKLRIGIHIGDVTHEDEDVFGDGVNVAARLEAMAEPGGVTISDAAFGTLDGTLRPAFDDAGEQALKNIARPVRVWTRGGVVGAAQTSEPDNKTGFPKLQIIPVAVSDTRPEALELADALTHDLEVFLGQQRWLRSSVVTAPTGDAYVLSTVLRISGNQLRLDTRLTDPDGAQVWGGKHDGALDNAFDWQDQTGEAVASQVSATLMERVLQVMSQKPDPDLTAEDWLVKSFATAKPDARTVTEILSCIARAIRLDPEFAYAYEWGLAMVATASSLGYHDVVAIYQPVVAGWTQKAGELTSGTSSSRAFLNYARYIQTGDVAHTRTEITAVLRDLPFDPEALIVTGFLFIYIGEPAKALECFGQFDKIARHHPNIAVVRLGTGAACLMLGRFEQALAQVDDAIAMVPGYVAAYRQRMAALAHLGRLKEARAALAKHDSFGATTTRSDIRSASNYVDTPQSRLLFDGLEMAGMAQ